MCNKPKDFLGNHIIIGDEVVFVEVSYRNMLRGTIKHLSPKTLIISYLDHYKKPQEAKQRHDQVVRIS